MPRVRAAQTSFALGEFSPLMAARSDLSQYRNGAARLLNRRLRAQGGTDTRPGLRYVAAVPEGPSRLIPYVFNAEQRYLLRLFHGGAVVYLPDGTGVDGFTGAPWAEAELRDLTFCQSGDTMLVFSGRGLWRPRRITRTGATSFIMEAMPLEAPPFYRFAHPSVPLTPTAFGGPGSAVTFGAGGAAFTASQVGSEVRFRGKRARITAVPNDATAVGEWIDDASSLANEGSIEWDEAAWNDRRGWPCCACFIDGRLAVGGSPELPNGIWLSKAGAFFNFMAGTADDSAIGETVASGSSGRILHLVPAARLLIFTDGGIWALSGAASGPITAKNVAIKPVSNTPASRLAPTDYDSATVFLDHSRAALREVLIDDQLGTYNTNPVSLLADHLIKAPVAMTILRSSPYHPEQYAFLACVDGTLTHFHSLRQEKVAAFTPWETAGAFRDVCALGGELFALTERAGAWRLERFAEDAEALDCSLRAYAATPSRFFPGFPHLAGRTVGVVSRGHDLGDVVVTGDGVVHLPESVPAVTEIEAGLRFRQVVTPMPIDFDLPNGPARGLVKRHLRVMLQVDRSGQMRVAGRRVLMEFRGDDVTTRPPLRTGLIRANLSGRSQDVQFDVEVAGAQKVTVLALTREVSLNG